jgi:hypothetical protein
MHHAMTRRAAFARLVLVVVCPVAAASLLHAADASSIGKTPLPRPRLTPAARARAEAVPIEPQTDAVLMDKVVVGASRLPGGPAPELPSDASFSITAGGYILKNHGPKFTTHVGLSRHIDVLESPSDRVLQGTGVRMEVLRVTW